MAAIELVSGSPFQSVNGRLRWTLDTSWEICVHRIASGRIRINKESSLQLHYAYILAQLGELVCTDTKDDFKVELETNYGGKNIDVWCSLCSVKAAIELKCFRISSNRAKDTDMYDVLKDISRLESYTDMSHRRLICLTDNEYYIKPLHRGHAGSVGIGNGRKYKRGEEIKPSWAGQWKNNGRDVPIVLENDIEFRWEQIGEWYYLYIAV